MAYLRSFIYPTFLLEDTPFVRLTSFLALVTYVYVSLLLSCLVCYFIIIIIYIDIIIVIIVIISEHKKKYDKRQASMIRATLVMCVCVCVACLNEVSTGKTFIFVVWCAWSIIYVLDALMCPVCVCHDTTVRGFLIFTRSFYGSYYCLQENC